MGWKRKIGRPPFVLWPSEAERLHNDVHVPDPNEIVECPACGHTCRRVFLRSNGRCKWCNEEKRS